MACLPSESAADRELVGAVAAGVLTRGELLVVGVVVWPLVHAAAAINQVRPNAAAATELIDLFGLTAEAPSSCVAGDLLGQRAV